MDIHAGYSVRENKEAIKNLLVANPEYINVNLPGNYTFLTYCFENDFNSEILMLLNFPNIEIKADNGNREPIKLAILKENTEFLSHPKVDINKLINITSNELNEIHPLTFALESDKLQSAKAIIENPELRVQEFYKAYELSPFQVIIDKQNEEILQSLLDLPNFDIHQELPSGNDIFGYAVRNEKELIIELILSQSKFDINTSINARYNFVDEIISNEKVKILEKILELNNFDPNAVYKKYNTILTEALSRGKSKIVKCLLNHDKIDVNIKYEGLDTPIEVAIKNKANIDIDLIKELVNKIPVIDYTSLINSIKTQDAKLIDIMFSKVNELDPNIAKPL